MSKLDPEFMRQEYNSELNFEQAKNFSNILNDKSVFESMTSSEYDRDLQRTKVNRKILRFITEAKKMYTLEQIFDDFGLFMNLCTPVNSYSGEMSTKFVVAYQLYYKTLRNLGSEIHDHFA